MGAVETFTIPEATVSLFAVDANGDPETDTPLWLGRAKGLRIRERLLTIKDYPTGVRYGITRHVDEEHEIFIDKVFAVDVPSDLPAAPSDIALQIATEGQASVTNSTDYRLRRNQEYVAVIAWQTEDNPDRYYYRTYYGVKDGSHELGGAGEDGQIDSNLSWTAEYYLS